MAAPSPIQVLLDDARPGRERLRAYRDPVDVIEAWAPEEAYPAFARIDAARRAGGHVAGYFSYELGYLLEPRLAPLLPRHRQVPLLWFGVFEDMDVAEGDAVNAALAAGGRAYAGPLRHGWSEGDYLARYARVHDWIEAGDIYQANLSFRSRFAFAGDPLALYGALRARSLAAHGAVVHDGARHILSLSPEQFFELSAAGELTARPMKGTAARGADPLSDAAARAALAASAKDRAENLMIVDLLRNDLGRVAETGSVAVRDLFEVETYPTLHTMVSTVTAKLRVNAAASDIIRAIFPCGSVTGAPKIRAMEIIRALEPDPRGLYCGAIGAFAPDGSADFNVAIRTLTIAGGEGELGIGGAIVADSTGAGEYAECLLKARYYDTARKPLALIETLRWTEEEGFVRLESHLARMTSSAEAFQIPFSQSAAMEALQHAISASPRLRVRLTLDEDGKFECTAAPLPPAQEQWRYAISPMRVNSTDALLRHKTTWRDLYEDEHARLGCDEVLFLNERGELCEGARSNLFLRLGGELLTPALECGLLPGILREELLEQGRAREAVLTLKDLANAEKIYFGNSLRGLIAAFPPPLAGEVPERSGGGGGKSKMSPVPPSVLLGAAPPPPAGGGK